MNIIVTNRSGHAKDFITLGKTNSKFDVSWSLKIAAIEEVSSHVDPACFIPFSFYIPSSHAQYHYKITIHPPECLSSYDGIISVGGDGMFSEILNGLLTRKENRPKVAWNVLFVSIN